MTAHRNRLYFHLQRTAAHLKAVADRIMLDAADITTSQAAILALIESQGPLKQNTLAKALEQKEAAVTQMVSKLEQRDLLVRRRSVGDQRAWDVEITKAGANALSQAKGEFSRINRLLDSALETDQHFLIDQLKAIRQALDRM